MTKPYYECHITLEDEPSIAMPVVIACGWTFSCIDGDIILGEGMKCYATKHFNVRKHSEEEIKRILFETELFMVGQALHPIRLKIEKVIFDNRRT